MRYGAMRCSSGAHLHERHAHHLCEVAILLRCQAKPGPHARHRALWMDSTKTPTQVARGGLEKPCVRARCLGLGCNLDLLLQRAAPESLSRQPCSLPCTAGTAPRLRFPPPAAGSEHGRSRPAGTWPRPRPSSTTLPCPGPGPDLQQLRDAGTTTWPAACNSLNCCTVLYCIASTASCAHPAVQQ